MTEAALYADKGVPSSITSDRCSNLLSAVNQAPEMSGISCFDQIMHRVSLATMDAISSKSSICKIVKMAASFNKSVPRASAFLAGSAVMG